MVYLRASAITSMSWEVTRRIGKVVTEVVSAICHSDGSGAPVTRVLWAGSKANGGILSFSHVGYGTRLDEVTTIIRPTAWFYGSYVIGRR